MCLSHWTIKQVFCFPPSLWRISWYAFTAWHRLIDSQYSQRSFLVYSSGWSKAYIQFACTRIYVPFFWGQKSCLIFSSSFSSFSTRSYALNVAQYLYFEISDQWRIVDQYFLNHPTLWYRLLQKKTLYLIYKWTKSALLHSCIVSELRPYFIISQKLWNSLCC